ncbi:MAG: thermonuclease family protein [Marinilabiliales bacterium]|nr:thermonuclease family protein [Marinilabiliales bacterium]
MAGRVRRPIHGAGRRKGGASRRGETRRPGGGTRRDRPRVPDANGPGLAIHGQDRGPRGHRRHGHDERVPLDPLIVLIVPGQGTEGRGSPRRSDHRRSDHRHHRPPGRSLSRHQAGHWPELRHGPIPARDGSGRFRRRGHHLPAGERAAQRRARLQGLLPGPPGEAGQDRGHLAIVLRHRGRGRGSQDARRSPECQYARRIRDRRRHGVRPDRVHEHRDHLGDRGAAGTRPRLRRHPQRDRRLALRRQGRDLCPIDHRDGERDHDHRQRAPVHDHPGDPDAQERSPAGRPIRGGSHVPSEQNKAPGRGGRSRRRRHGRGQHRGGHQGPRRGPRPVRRFVPRPADRDQGPLRNEPLGYEIYDFTKRQLEGQTVRLFTWTTDDTAAGIVYDEEGYARVQIFYGRLSGEKGGGVSFNEVMLKKGYARVDPKYLPDDLKHYYALEKEARENGLGIWKGR